MRLIYQAISFFFIFILSEISFAETTTTELRGTEKKFIIDLLGPPEKMSITPSSNRDSSEILHYGQSKIILLNDRVSSVIDLGEIKAKLQRGGGPRPASAWVSWPNPWTPPKSVTDEILMEAIRQEDKKD